MQGFDGITQSNLSVNNTPNQLHAIKKSICACRSFNLVSKDRQQITTDKTTTKQKQMHAYRSISKWTFGTNKLIDKSLLFLF